MRTQPRDGWLTARETAWKRVILRVRRSTNACNRRAEALAVDAVLLSGLSLHLSAGVGAFKGNRGTEPEVEYSAVFSRHLAPHRRFVIRGLARVLESVVVPMVRKREL